MSKSVSSHAVRFGLMSLAVAVVLAVSSAVWSWETFQNDASRNGLAVTGPANVSRVVWESGAENLLAGTNPVLSDTHAFVLAPTQAIAFDRADGGVAWRTPIADSSEFYSWASMTWDRETASVYFGSGNHVYRLNDADGDIVWDVTTTHSVVNCTPLVVEGRVLILDSGTFNPAAVSLYVLDASTGTELNRLPVTGSGSCSPAYDPVSRRIYLAVDSTLAAWDIDSGTEVWKGAWRSDDQFYGGVAFAGGALYAQTSAFAGFGRLYKVDAADGAIIWEVPVLENGNATPVVADGLVVVQGGFFNGRTIAHRDSDGSVAWTADQGDWLTSCAASANGFVYTAGNRDTGLLVLSVANGEVQDRLPDIASCTPAVRDGVVYAVSTRGGLMALTAAPRLFSADLNFDGRVDYIDLLILSEQWHNETDYAGGEQ